MKISTKARYGLRAMIYLTEKNSEEICSLKEIAEAKNISFDYLEKIMAELRKAELVQSQQGARGGYTLKRKPSQIKVGEIIRTLEGTEIIGCVGEENCPQEKTCLAKGVWKKLKNSINQSLDSITLEDLIKT